MDPVTIGLLASTTVKALGAFFKDTALKAGDELSEQASTGAVGIVKRLLARLRTKFRADPDASKSLQEFQERPSDEGAVSEFQRILTDRLATDEVFAKNVESDLKQIIETNADIAFVNNIQGDVQKLVQIQTVHGDVNL